MKERFRMIDYLCDLYYVMVNGQRVPALRVQRQFQLGGLAGESFDVIGRGRLAKTRFECQGPWLQETILVNGKFAGGLLDQNFISLADGHTLINAVFWFWALPVQWCGFMQFVKVRLEATNLCYANLSSFDKGKSFMTNGAPVYCSSHIALENAQREHSCNRGIGTEQTQISIFRRIECTCMYLLNTASGAKVVWHPRHKDLVGSNVRAYSMSFMTLSFFAYCT
mmetsp:Transcript_243/g.346  ORF Transcript_243/g.346 Transcript_243/m.346 type:complete len:224 (+) Transcript_243:534-1205(+)